MIIEYCATRLIPKMKIDFCPNKYRLILLSCPLQLISIDSRSPSGLQSLPNFKMVIKMCFNSRSPSGLRRAIYHQAVLLGGFNSRSPSGLRLSAVVSLPSKLVFQFTQPKRAATIFGYNPRYSEYVSIHAAQAGCDQLFNVTLTSS